jgi:enoyl-[acyl-carrier-protein] reductase (NADH)
VGTVATERATSSLSEHHGLKAADIFFTSVDELANTIVFLLSDRASGISGQTLSVDSGLSARFCSDTRPFQVVKRNPSADQ